MDELQLRTEQAKGRTSQDLLRKLDPYFKDLEDKLVEAFKAAPVRDVDGLQGIKYQLKSLEAIRLLLQTEINTGKLAEHELKQRRESKLA